MVQSKEEYIIWTGIKPGHRSGEENSATVRLGRLFQLQTQSLVDD